MSRINQVYPTPVIATGIHTNKSFEILSADIDDETANTYQTLLRKYVSRKFCYHSDAATEVKIIKVHSRVAFQIDIWTLMEKRWVKSISAPYDGEDTPGQTVGELFDAENYNLKADTTIVRGNQTGRIILPETQKTTNCVACNGEGKKSCPTCHGDGQIKDIPCSKCTGRGYSDCLKCSKSGKILQRNEMNCKRYTLHSVTYPKDTFLPDECIANSKGKSIFFEDDVLYENEPFVSNFDDLDRMITEESHYDFRKVIEKQFNDNHLSKMDKSTQIRRVKCSIQRIDIMEIDYQAGDYVNKASGHKGPNTFTFLLYGRDIKNNPEIYENDYPLNTCGCLGHNCACRSKCCSIS